MSNELVLLMLLLSACLIFMICVIFYDKELTRLLDENTGLKEEINYWKNRMFKKDDVINDIYQFIKKHYEI